MASSRQTGKGLTSCTCGRGKSWTAELRTVSSSSSIFNLLLCGWVAKEEKSNMSGMFDLLLDVVVSTSLALCMHRRRVCVLASKRRCVMVEM